VTDKPLILLTNDDGINSPGLHAVAAAVADLGDLLIVAPSSQRTGAGHSYPPVRDKTVYPTDIPLGEGRYPAYKADVSPAQAVALAVLKLAPRPIDLCISGINYGENLGASITTSGTIGAAIEAAYYDIPALATSAQTPKEYHIHYSAEFDFSVTAHFVRVFAKNVLERGLPTGVKLLKIDVPQSATTQTPWQITTVSRQRYYHPVSRGSQHDGKFAIEYESLIDYETLEQDSDIYAFAVNQHVPVAAIIPDLSARVATAEVAGFFNGHSPSSK
jgi:5'-nucleotidase